MLLLIASACIIASMIMVIFTCYFLWPRSIGSSERRIKRRPPVGRNPPELPPPLPDTSQKVIVGPGSERVFAEPPRAPPYEEPIHPQTHLGRPFLPEPKPVELSELSPDAAGNGIAAHGLDVFRRELGLVQGDSPDGKIASASPEIVVDNPALSIANGSRTNEKRIVSQSGTSDHLSEAQAHVGISIEELKSNTAIDGLSSSGVLGQPNSDEALSPLPVTEEITAADRTQANDEAIENPLVEESIHTGPDDHTSEAAGIEVQEDPVPQEILNPTDVPGVAPEAVSSSEALTERFPPETETPVAAEAPDEDELMEVAESGPQSPSGAAEPPGDTLTSPEEQYRGEEPAPSPEIDLSSLLQFPAPNPGAVFRDRRGASRKIDHAARERAAGYKSAGVQRGQAELRLTIDPVNKNVALSAVLSRPEGFPDTVVLAGLDADALQAFDETRYDDIDLEWDPELLQGELRLRDATGRYEWVRSARPIHLFSASVGEADLLTVAAAALDREHAVVCQSNAADSVVALAAEAGSPSLTDCSSWSGVPEGWMVFQGYVPSRAVADPISVDLRPLDPGHQITIAFDGGLEIRSGCFAESRAPRISIVPLPENCQVLIDGEPASQAANGAWEAEDYASPGRHLVNVVPGPSRSYEILPDPGRTGWSADGETQWPTVLPNAWICGAAIQAPAGRFAIAFEPAQSLCALGANHFVAGIPMRCDVPAAVALLSFEPAFVLVSWGGKRTQGFVLWRGTAPQSFQSAPPDRAWCAVLRAAVARRLSVKPSVDRATAAWKKAVLYSRTRRFSR